MIYPKNSKGYIELIDIVSYQRKLNFNQLLEITDNNNVVIKSDSYFSYLLNENDLAQLNYVIERLSQYENIYISSLANNKAINNKINDIVLPLCRNYNVKTIAIDLALYSKEQDYEAYKCLRAIDKATNINDTNLSLVTDASLKSSEAMYLLFDKQSLDNIDYFINSIDFDLDSLKQNYPFLKHLIQ